MIDFGHKDEPEVPLFLTRGMFRRHWIAQQRDLVAIEGINDRLSADLSRTRKWLRDEVSEHQDTKRLLRLMEARCENEARACREYLEANADLQAELDALEEREAGRERAELQTRIDAVNAALPVGKERTYVGKRVRIVAPAYIEDEEVHRVPMYQGWGFSAWFDEARTPGPKGVTIHYFDSDGDVGKETLSLEDSEAWAPVKRNS